MAKYYACSLRKVLKSILPPSIRGKVQHKEQLFVKSTLSLNALVTLCEDLRNFHPLQAQVIDVLLKAPKGVLLSELIEKSQTSRSPINTLIKKRVAIGEQTILFLNRRGYHTPQMCTRCAHVIQ